MSMEPVAHELKSNKENPERAEADWPAAVIAGAWRTGVLAMRGLVRRGVRVCCFDSNRSYEGFRSRYGPAYACPDPDSDAKGWLEFMIGLSKKIGGQPALIASADQFVSAIAAYESELRPHYLVSAAAALQGRLSDKQTQYALAARHGMPLPRTEPVRSVQEVTAFADTAQFPCLLKPFNAREWQVLPPGHPLYDMKIALVETPAQLIQSWRWASEANSDVVAQEVIVGPDTAKRVYFSCYAGDGRRIGNALFRELRCNPVGFGPATVSEPVDDPEADAVCDRFLRSLGYSGICEIEAKRDLRDGRLKLIEVNPRLSGNGDAAPYAGVDLGWLHYLDLIGKEVMPVAPSARPFRHVVLVADAAAVIRYKRARLLPWRDLARSYRPPLVFFDLDWRDWRYSVRTIYRMARVVARELVYWALPSVRPSRHDTAREASLLKAHREIPPTPSS